MSNSTATTAYFNTETGAVWVGTATRSVGVVRKASDKLDAADALGESGLFIRRGDWLPAFGPVWQAEGWLTIKGQDIQESMLDQPVRLRYSCTPGGCRCQTR